MNVLNIKWDHSPLVVVVVVTYSERSSVYWLANAPLILQTKTKKEKRTKTESCYLDKQK